MMKKNILNGYTITILVSAAFLALAFTTPSIKSWMVKDNLANSESVLAVETFSKELQNNLKSMEDLNMSEYPVSFIDGFIEQKTCNMNKDSFNSTLAKISLFKKNPTNGNLELIYKQWWDEVSKCIKN